MHAGRYPIRVGISGWSLLSRTERDMLPGRGPVLARYGRLLEAVEVNTTFYRSHAPETYRRWAEQVPEEFRFAVKMPGWLTHRGRLRRLEGLERFIAEVQHLGPKLGPVLVQLPPSLRFCAQAAEVFFRALRDRFSGPVACEAREASWFSEEADRLLADLRIARVVADPAPVAGELWPGGWPEWVYVRLHGRPMYYGVYEEEEIRRWAERLLGWSASAPVWCFFNNTASARALEAACRLRQMLSGCL
nr:MAG: hypothetical protein KatS3mg041_1000 [Bacteroidota bacterium]